VSKKADARAAKAAAELAAQQARERRRNLSIGALVLVLLVAIVSAGFLVRELTGGDSDVDTSAGTAEHSLTLGEDSAPHQVIIYEDFLCPYCGELERASHEELRRLVDEGQVQVTYRPFHLLQDFEYSGDALEVLAAVMETADPDVQEDLHNALFAEQPSESGPFPSQDDLVDLAVEQGADRDAVEAELDSDRPEQWVETATQEAQSAGVNSTPTVVLDGEQFTDFRTIDDLVTNLVAAIEAPADEPSAPASSGSAQ